MKRIPLSEEELNEQKVILKPIFGIQPESYIKYVYAVLALLVLFLIFFLPGIMKSGTNYQFNTTPEGASVYVDDIRLGASPGRYFVARGQRKITIKSPYHETWESEVKIKGRLFATLIFKRNRDFDADLISDISPELMDDHHLMTASWFQSDEGFSSLKLPPDMQDLMKAYYRSSDRKQEVDSEYFEEYLKSLLRTAAYDNSYRQWLEAFILYETEGKALNSSNLLSAAADSAAFLAENPELLILLKEFHEIPELKLPASRAQNKITFDIEGEILQPVSSDPLRFIPVGTYTELSEKYTFFVADREITKGWYLRFLADNPEWTSASKEKLIADGLVDDNYLTDWEDNQLTEYSQEPLHYVSLFAAQAFNDWFNEKYINSYDMNVRLPDEWEWEEISIANGLTSRDRPSQKNLGALEAGSFLPGELDLYDMEGNLWEWCENGFGTNDVYLYNSLSHNSSFSFPDNAVRGGSWANPPGQVKPETRGSQPGNWCTAYTGFRPVILQKR
ncbi:MULTISPECIES: SUMF1/EgtB/PvdO family nonheme iron enzyme [unclassified Oceanispirochaeta]|uniref:SUMF1/EgtB/PvdO family nonheme iron enzyme n=1 Tax=unclassified Oceanispirochaeta TaxID=2635722 RepID=UPI000E08D241|nr:MULTISPECIES: SUMF1/EgtB/PvdO family nonheme iron enzyme [unclassified Oceanispirochaeta]MBF9015153.1 SUMF1/EgtB/PvdO family nonheme iron enzyme [Oceanispirochaeta sp. M2]NPD71611.1 SUMF1/EgtB/PvdO family nonheme iron enzyme [Oceanispirochaeta sp. M1]RDG33178.1 PEGA domain-containing protein [Oceanispirochaeta sp. M1]